jgi:hypothetical protein
VRWGHGVVQAQGDGRLQGVVYAPLNGAGAPDLTRATTTEADTLCLGCGWGAAVVADWAEGRA